MSMPKRYPLKVNHPYSAPHDAQVFICDLRSKAATDAYFNTFGAGTVTYFGTEGIDYEFDLELGFRTKTNSGGIRIITSNMLSALETTYFYENGYSFDFQLLTSEWIEPEYSPALYQRPVTDLAGGNASALNGNWMFYFWNNASTTGASGAMALDFTATFPPFGRNRLTWQPGYSNTGPYNNMCCRPISSLNKEKFLTCRVTAERAHGNMWIDGMSAVTPHTEAITPATGGTGGRFTKNLFASEHSLQTTGNTTLFIGTFNGASSACTRWIRNIRLFKTPTANAIHPKLARVVSFGDSYSSQLLGPQAGSASVDNLGAGLEPGSYNATLFDYFADIHPTLRFHQLLAQAGFQSGGSYGTGTGGLSFAQHLAGGWVAQAIRYKPTMVFSYGMYNDITALGAGATTIAALQTMLLDSFLNPMFNAGCSGWGFAIPSIGQHNFLLGYSSAHNAVTNMLLGLPAALAIAYPQHAGKLKIRDVGNKVGVDWANNKNWRYYWSLSDNVHPSRYGEIIAAEAFAEMAIEWLYNS